MEAKSVTIEKVENGYTVDFSYTERDEKGETDYKSKEWIFATKEEAIAKIVELVA